MSFGLPSDAARKVTSCSTMGQGNLFVRSCLESGLVVKGLRYLLLGAVGLGLGVACCEWVLAPRLLPPPGYFVKPPGEVWRAELGQGVLPGVDGPAELRFTAEGIRADPDDPADRYRILCIGGSTTECAVLDTDEAWPHLVQDRLRAAAPALHAWVGNAGGSGLNTRQHIAIFKHVVPRLRCDAVIHLVGINDLMRRIANDAPYVSLTPEQILTDGESLDRAFAVHPTKGYLDPWYKRTNIWRVARIVKRTIRELGQAPELARMTRYDYATQRARLQERRRTKMTARTAMPDLTESLAEFERNLRYLIDQSRQQGCRLIFMTQPTLWSDSPSDEIRSHLSFAQIGRDPFLATEYYAPEALAEGIARYNAVTLRVAGELGVECIDLASIIPKDLTSFYDDCHFNEPGARASAAAIDSNRGAPW